MKKILKIIGTTCLAIVLAVTLTGCGTPKTTAPNELVVWGFVDEDVMKPIIQDFKSSHKGLAVTYVKKTLDGGYEDTTLNSILSDEGPDVWAIPNDWVYRHKDKLAAAPANLFSNKKITPADYFVAPMLADNMIDKQVYGLAPSVDVLQVYYNPILFENARRVFSTQNQNNQDFLNSVSPIFNRFPITWSEFDKIIPYLTTHSGNNISVAGAAIGTSNNVSKSQDVLSLLMLQNQTKMTSDDLTQATFNLPIKSASGGDVFPGRNSLDFYTKYSDPNNSLYTWNAAMPNDIEAFVQGKVAMIFGYSSLATYLRQLYPNFDFQQAKMPQIGDVNSVVDYLSYTTYVVPANSKQIQSAWDMVLLLSTDEASTYCSATKELSAKKQSTDTTLKARGSGAPDTSQIETAKTWNKGRYPVETDNQLKDAISRVVNRSQNSQASLDTAAANITELLRRATW